MQRQNVHAKTHKPQMCPSVVRSNVGNGVRGIFAHRNRVLPCGFDLGNTILRDDLCTQVN